MEYVERSVELDLTMPQSKDISVLGMGAATIQADLVSGVWSSAVVTIKRSVDGVNWYTFASSITFAASGLSEIASAQLLQGRLRAEVTTTNAGGGTVRISVYAKEI